jgi:hypothetical protein
MAFITWQHLEHSVVHTGTKNPFFSLRRAKVPGGWLVLVCKIHQGDQGDWAWGAGFGGLTFVPDPEHRWDGNSME